MTPVGTIPGVMETASSDAAPPRTLPSEDEEIRSISKASTGEEDLPKASRQSGRFNTAPAPNALPAPTALPAPLPVTNKNSSEAAHGGKHSHHLFGHARRTDRQSTKDSHVSVTSSHSFVRRSISKVSSYVHVEETIRHVMEVVKVDPLSCTVSTAGAVLAFSAGVTNVVAFLGLGAFVSHATGTLTKTGLRIEDGETSVAAEVFGLILAFIVGSGICGCIISRGNVAFSNGLYGVALVASAVLLVAAVLSAPSDISPYIVAAACGLQNGVATSYSGAVIRVTHATGLTTDIGLLSGRALVILAGRLMGKPRPPPEKDIEHRKLLLLVVLFLSFLTGAVTGAVLHGSAGVDALLLPAALVGAPGAVYALYRWNEQRKEARKTPPARVSSATAEADSPQAWAWSKGPNLTVPSITVAVAKPDGQPKKEVQHVHFGAQEEAHYSSHSAAWEAMEALEQLLPKLQEATALGDVRAAKECVAAMEAGQRCKAALSALARSPLDREGCPV